MLDAWYFFWQIVFYVQDCGCVFLNRENAEECWKKRTIQDNAQQTQRAKKGTPLPQFFWTANFQSFSAPLPLPCLFDFQRNSWFLVQYQDTGAPSLSSPVENRVRMHGSVRKKRNRGIFSRFFAGKRGAEKVSICHAGGNDGGGGVASLF